MVKNGWYICPNCGKNIQKVNNDTMLIHVPLFCKKCKTESKPHIVNGVEYIAEVIKN